MADKKGNILYLTFYNRGLEILFSTGLFIVLLSSYPILERTNLYKAYLFFVDST